MDKSQIEQMRKKGYFSAANKWLDDEMWNHRDRRPPDLHDVSAFARAYREGFKDGVATEAERQAQAEQFQTLIELLEAGDVESVKEWLRGGIKTLERQA